MTIETLQQANTLQGRIDATKNELSQVNLMLDETKETKIKVRVRGADFELPKAVFKGELLKQKKVLESQLTDLENEFSTL